MFVAPALSDDQAIQVIQLKFFGLDQDVESFLAVMSYLLDNGLFRIRTRFNLPILSAARFDLSIDDATAIVRFRFSISQLISLAELLKLPEVVETASGDKIDRVQALAMVC